MNVKLNKSNLGLAASIMLFAALPVQAADKYGSVYVVDSWDRIVKDPYGNCVRTPYWAAAKNIAECGAVAQSEQAQPISETITLGADAFFDFDRADLKPAGHAKLDKLATDLHRIRADSILVVGHTDSKGTPEYNLRLGQRRADGVAGYLGAKQGVPHSIISTRSAGEADPVAPNSLPNGKDNPAGRALNRRVVITVTANEHIISQ